MTTVSTMNTKVNNLDFYMMIGVGIETVVSERKGNYNFEMLIYHLEVKPLYRKKARYAKAKSK